MMIPDFQLQAIQSLDPRITVGRHSYGNPLFMVWSEDDRIEVGSFCSIAGEVVIAGGGEHRSDWITTYPLRIAFGLEGANLDGHPASKGKTVIGNDVWIGFRAIVLSGVTIGDGAVIGAGAVVSRDVEPYSVVAGNPARKIRSRFSQDDISVLQAIRWWEWPLDMILEHADVLCSGNIERLKTVAKNAGVSV